MESVKRHLKEELGLIADKIRARAINIVESEKMVVTGHLKNSIQTKTVVSDTETYILIYVAEGGKLSGSTKYPKYLHEGIKPHMPPVDKIKEWVRKKGIATNDINKAWTKAQGMKRSKRPKKQDLIDKKITQTAWAIAVNMKKNGRKPSPFLELAVKMTFNELGVRS